MTIKIGGVVVATRKPQDLADRLLAPTGCSVDEAKAWLSGDHPQPTHVAMALQPFLSGDDAPGVPELGAMIAAAGPADVAALVADLYSSAEAKAEA